MNSSDYKKILNNIPNTIFQMFDMDLRVTGIVGEKTLREAGYEIEDLEGKTIDEAYGDRLDVLYFYKPLWKRALEGIPNYIVMPHAKKGSDSIVETMWYQSILPLYDDNNKITGGLSISKDITDEATQIGEIRRQKTLLYDISNVNSHQLLAEVARIQGLLALIMDEKPNLSKKGMEIFNKMKEPIDSLRKIAQIIDGLAGRE